MRTFVYCFSSCQQGPIHPGSRITGVPINPDSLGFSPNVYHIRLGPFHSPSVFYYVGALSVGPGDTIASRLVDSPARPSSPTSTLGPAYKWT